MHEDRHQENPPRPSEENRQEGRGDNKEPPRKRTLLPHREKVTQAEIDLAAVLLEEIRIIQDNVAHKIPTPMEGVKFAGPPRKRKASQDYPLI